MEELEINLDLENTTSKKCRPVPFPAVHLGSMTIVFNAPAARLMQNWAGIKVMHSAENIVFLPVRKTGMNAYAIYHRKDCSGCLMYKPTAIRERKWKNAQYRLYRYKDGFAIKREPLEDEP